jgi:hypothetical protein
LDQNITRRMRARLPGHLVVWAGSLSWGEFKNGDLIDTAERNGYEVLVTADQGIYYQQNNAEREISLVVLSTNDWRLLQQNIGPINAAVLRSERGSFELVQIAAKPRGEQT